MHPNSNSLALLDRVTSRVASLERLVHRSAAARAEISEINMLLSSLRETLQVKSDPAVALNVKQEIHPENLKRNLRMSNEDTCRERIQQYISASERFSQSPSNMIFKSKTHRLATLGKLLDTLVSMNSCDHVLDCYIKVSTSVKNLLRAERALLYIYNPLNKKLYALDEMGNKFTCRNGQGITGHAAEWRIPIVINGSNKVTTHRDYDGTVDSIGSDTPLRSIYCQPIIASSRLVGVLQICNKMSRSTGTATNNSSSSTSNNEHINIHTHGSNNSNSGGSMDSNGMNQSQSPREYVYNDDFNEEDRFIVDMVEEQLRWTLSKLLDKQEMQKLKRQYEGLLEISKSLTSELELDNVVKIIMNKAKKLVQADRCSFFFVDYERREFYSKMCDGADSIRVPFHCGIIGEVFNTRRSINVQDARKNRHWDKNIEQQTGYRTRSILTVPIFSGLVASEAAAAYPSPHIVGIIQMINKLPRPLCTPAPLARSGSIDLPFMMNADEREQDRRTRAETLSDGEDDNISVCSDDDTDDTPRSALSDTDSDDTEDSLPATATPHLDAVLSTSNERTVSATHTPVASPAVPTIVEPDALGRKPLLRRASRDYLSIPSATLSKPRTLIDSTDGGTPPLLSPHDTAHDTAQVTRIPRRKLQYSEQLAPPPSVAAATPPGGHHHHHHTSSGHSPRSAATMSEEDHSAKLRSRSSVDQFIQKTTSETDEFFTAEDQQIIEYFTKFVRISLSNSTMYETAIKKKNKASKLLKIYKSISSDIEMDALLQKITTQARVLINADRATIFMVDHERKELYTRFVEGIDSLRIPIDTGIAGCVFRTKSLINIPDAYEDPRFCSEVDKNTGYHTRNILCVPIINHQGHVIGITQMINKLPPSDSFRHEDEQLLLAFARDVAIYIENAKIYEQAKENENRALDLAQKNNDQYCDLETKILIKIITDRARALSSATRCSMFLLNNTRTELLPVNDRAESLLSSSDDAAQIFSDDSDVDPDGNTVIRVSDNSGVQQCIRSLECVLENSNNEYVLYYPLLYVNELVGILKMTKNSPFSERIADVVQHLSATSSEVLSRAFYSKTFEREDQDLIQSLSPAASVSIKKSELFQRSAKVHSFLQAVLDSISNIVFAFDTRGLLVRSNHALDFLGLSKSTLTTLPCAQWILHCHPRNRQFFRDLLNCHHYGNSVHSVSFEYIVNASDRASFPSSSASTPPSPHHHHSQGNASEPTTDLHASSNSVPTSPRALSPRKRTTARQHSADDSLKGYNTQFATVTDNLHKGSPAGSHLEDESTTAPTSAVRSEFDHLQMPVRSSGSGMQSPGAASTPQTPRLDSLFISYSIIAMTQNGIRQGVAVIIEDVTTQNKLDQSLNILESGTHALISPQFDPKLQIHSTLRMLLKLLSPAKRILYFLCDQVATKPNTTRSPASNGTSTTTTASSEQVPSASMPKQQQQQQQQQNDSPHDSNYGHFRIRLEKQILSTDPFQEDPFVRTPNFTSTMRTESPAVPRAESFHMRTGPLTTASELEGHLHSSANPAHHGPKVSLSSEEIQSRVSMSDSSIRIRAATLSSSAESHMRMSFDDVYGLESDSQLEALLESLQTPEAPTSPLASSDPHDQLDVSSDVHTNTYKEETSPSTHNESTEEGKRESMGHGKGFPKMPTYKKKAKKSSSHTAHYERALPKRRRKSTPNVNRHSGGVGSTTNTYSVPVEENGDQYPISFYYQRIINETMDKKHLVCKEDYQRAGEWVACLPLLVGEKVCGLIYVDGLHQALTHGQRFMKIFGTLITCYMEINNKIQLESERAGLQHQTDQLLRSNQVLEQLKDAAQKSEKAKASFLMNISHEIRTPLNSIIGLSELLLSNDHTDSASSSSSVHGGSLASPIHFTPQPSPPVRAFSLTNTRSAATSTPTITTHPLPDSLLTPGVSATSGGGNSSGRAFLLSSISSSESEAELEADTHVLRHSSSLHSASSSMWRASHARRAASLAGSHSRILPPPEMNRQHRKFIKTIYKSSKSLLNIINDLLDVSKIDANQLVLNNIEFNLLSTVEDTIDMFASNCYKKSLEILLYIQQVSHALPPSGLFDDEPLPMSQDTDGPDMAALFSSPGRRASFQMAGEGVDEFHQQQYQMESERGVLDNNGQSREFQFHLVGDSYRLRQVLSNLLSNACKFSPTGASIEIHLWQTRTLTGHVEVHVQVIDHGIGIKQENFGALFQPFSQIDVSTTRNFEGTGLGLVICKKLVSLLGGEIQIVSEYGRGTTVQFSCKFLPSAVSDELDLRSLHRLRRVAVHHAPILLVSHFHSRQLIASLFERFQYSFTAADSLEQVSALFSQPMPVPMSGGRQAGNPGRGDSASTTTTTTTTTTTGFREDEIDHLDLPTHMRILLRLSKYDCVFVDLDLLLPLKQFIQSIREQCAAEAWAYESEVYASCLSYSPRFITIGMTVNNANHPFVTSHSMLLLPLKLKQFINTILYNRDNRLLDQSATEHASHPALRPMATSTDDLTSFDYQQQQQQQQQQSAFEFSLDPDRPTHPLHTHSHTNIRPPFKSGSGGEHSPVSGTSTPTMGASGSQASSPMDSPKTSPPPVVRRGRLRMSTSGLTPNRGSPEENESVMLVSSSATPITAEQDVKMSSLLVEDNLVNRKLILRQLQKINVTPDVAVNGLEAVEMFKKHHYKIIFMDCHMPVMDGYTASTTIREITKDPMNPIIIALTADAIQGARDKCLCAGMNEYYTKPLLHKDFLEIQKKYLVRASSPSRSP